MKAIGIFTRIEVLNSKEVLCIPHNIYKYLQHKSRVVIIPFNKKDKYKDILPLVKKCDGIIIPGGDNIYPQEIELIKYLYKKNIPTLGICLGMQEMSVCFDAKMKTGVGHFHKIMQKYVHSIQIDKKSKLAKIIKNEEIIVNSRHKDYIIKPKLNIVATCDDIIEAVEDPNKKFFIGVQWHPEDLNDKYSKRIFKYFIDSL